MYPERYKYTVFQAPKRLTEINICGVVTEYQSIDNEKKKIRRQLSVSKVRLQSTVILSVGLQLCSLLTNRLVVLFGLVSIGCSVHCTCCSWGFFRLNFNVNRFLKIPAMRRELYVQVRALKD
uniref:Uncharacterized protein n=1 Tax=Glossina brevipalpis TaxID=37001 RepID=A0A1A9X4X0_9MUSC